MDGIHDLGGKQGYGPIEVDEAEVPFHHEWEGREWGISRCARTPGISIDWWRHCRELIKPEDYLMRPYFDSWAQTDLATYIDAGMISLEDIIAVTNSTKHHVDGSAPGMSRQQVLEADRKKALRFDAEIEAEPRFKVGDEVITIKHGHAGHSRLPQYARDRSAVIHAHHGAHIFPDLSAEGQEVHQHLYSVMFEAADLWPENQGNNKIFLDLWENYLSGSSGD